MAGRSSFGSDNHAPAHPDILKAVAAANQGHTPAYGDDPWTAAAEALLKEHFGPEARPFLVWNGTGANVLALKALCRSWEAVLCPASAHIHTDETGAPEHQAGIKLITVDCPDGKLTPDLLQAAVTGIGNPHHVQPRLVSLSQTTEFGTVYSPREITALCTAAHGLGLLVHLDGARLANACAATGHSLRQLTTDCGVDVVSFGGTKNGLLFGEALVFLRPKLAEGMEYLRKQSLQLASKMRYLGAQFQALLTDGLYLQTAAHANAMACRLAEGLGKLEGLTIAFPVQANAVFVRLPRSAGEALLQDWTFYWWDEQTNLARLMTAWDTPPTDVDHFVAAAAAALKKTIPLDKVTFHP